LDKKENKAKNPNIPEADGKTGIGDYSFIRLPISTLTFQPLYNRVHIDPCQIFTVLLYALTFFPKLLLTALMPGHNVRIVVFHIL
jgi:hypothetical protein